MGYKRKRRKFSFQSTPPHSAPNSRRLHVEHLEDRRLLAAVTVTNNLDILNGDTSSIANLIASDGGDGIALREAIAAANTDVVADTIDFDASLSGGTLLLTEGELVLIEELTIDASNLSGNLTIDAQQNSRLFNITASTGDFTFRGLTLTGGYTSDIGGAIYSSATGHLTVEQSTISGNQAGNSAGGIGFFGHVTLINSTISNNHAEGGGGIFSGISGEYELTLINSTVSGNSASENAGGIASFGGVTLINSTVSGNSTSDSSAHSPRAGGIFTFGHVTLTNSTVTGNSVTRSTSTTLFETGGIFANSGSTLLHSIVAGNTVDSGNSDLNGSVQANYSLIGNNGGTGLTEAPLGSPDSNGNLIGGSTNGLIAPRLGPLTNNGGPTKTHALLAGSPAIDAGDPAFASPPANDQRGAPFLRIADGNADGSVRIDIGAFEVPTTLIVTTNIDEDDGLHDPLLGTGTSLREAIAFANSIFIPFNIAFDPSLDAATIQIDQLNLGALPTITDNLSIDASNLAGGLTIHAGYGLDATPGTGDGIQAFVIFDFDLSTQINVQLTGLKITGGDVSTTGGGISSSEHLTVVNSEISGNSAGSPGSILQARGGGISVDHGSLVVIGSNISNNSTTARSRSYGGGIFAQNSQLEIENSTISDNSALSAGGGIYSAGGDVIITDSIISRNAATQTRFGGSSPRGGGFAFSSGIHTISGSLISNNIANSGFGVSGTVKGGGIYMSPSSSLTINRSSVSGNSSKISGGGIYNFAGQLKILNSTITNNTAIGGSGVSSRSGETYIHSSIVAGNVNGDIELEGTINGFLSGGYNLIGTSDILASFNQPGDQIGILDPRLGPLADNGGPTKTHALLPGSPALDAGNSTASTDQRGNTAPVDLAEYQNAPGGNGRDIGAYEAQTPPSADFDNSNYVTGLDFLAWQRGFGSTDATKPQGNSDDDTDVDASDLAAWAATFGGGPSVAADFDTSGNVGGLDFLAWQRGFGIVGPDATKPNGNANLDTAVDTDDLGVWKNLFGHQAPLAYTTPVASPPLLAAVSSPTSLTPAAPIVSATPQASFRVAQLAHALENTSPQRKQVNLDFPVATANQPQSPALQDRDRPAETLSSNPQTPLLVNKSKPPRRTAPNQDNINTTDEAFAQLADTRLATHF